jgi:hypothetical protein
MGLVSFPIIKLAKQNHLSINRLFHLRFSISINFSILSRFLVIYGIPVYQTYCSVVWSVCAHFIDNV